MVGAPIRQVAARAYKVPTDTLEAHGTLSWDRTTLVVMQSMPGRQPVLAIHMRIRPSWV
jgi:hypothetical protein